MKRQTTALARPEPAALATQQALHNAITLWADATTDAETPRRQDLLRDKARVLADFFTFTRKHPAMVTALDVKTWQAELESRGLAPSTVYAHVSRLSSFYRWALSDPGLAAQLHRNPVDLARPKPPRAYQSESAQALDDEEARALVATVKAKADAGALVGKRDLALLLMYLLTGLRRREVIRLRWRDVRLGQPLRLRTRLKGGEYHELEVTDPHAQTTLLDYLEASGRLAGMQPDDPLWTRHDRAGEPGKPLTGHAFALNLKRYARQAGLGDIHLHQTRHTYARIAGDELGSIVDVQHALGHKREATTRAYLQRVAVKRDKLSGRIARRLGLRPEPADAP